MVKITDKSISPSRAGYIKKQLLKRIRAELSKKYGQDQDISAILDTIDISALIDPTLSYSENLSIIENEINMKLNEITKQQISDYEKLANSVIANLETNEIVYFENGKISGIYINGIYEPISYVQTKLYIPRVSSRKLKNMAFSRFRKMLLPQLNELYNYP
jgi:citrate lyase alpha subunit